MPTPLAEKIRSLAQIPAKSPLFDAQAIGKSLTAGLGADRVDVRCPTPESVRAEATILDLEKALARSGLKEAGIAAYRRGGGRPEFRIRLERGSSKPLAALFSGLDPFLVDALSPPALEEEPVSRADYRTMLASVLGEAALAALETCGVELSLTAPNQVIASGGGRLAGTTISERVPFLDLLVLETPIELWLRWKE
jgi:hypothetical protein